ncbi:MAG: hypothetical protein KGH94_00775 [Candidatus Micrarchaeota archaeon]|nr:hypothetical protein [Candidatus Micrarchaeota archaeon]
MPGANEKAGSYSNTMSSMLQFEQNPRRRMLILLAVALVVVAVLGIFAASLSSAGGCNAVLSAQRFGCIAALAWHTGNVALCSKIGNQGAMASCVTAIAEEKENSTYCSALGGNYRTNCVDNVSYSSSKPSLCNVLEGNNQSLCMYNVIAKLNFSDQSYCPAISEIPYKVMCYAQSYYGLALSTGNYSYCSYLPQSENATIAYAMELQNPSYRSSAGSILTGVINATPRDLCYDSFSRKDQASCSYISSQALRSVCSSSYAQPNTTFSVQAEVASCSNATTTQLKDLCYFGVYANQALITGNETWCGQIANQSYMRSCIVNLATSSSNDLYCNALQNSSQAASCMEEVQLSGGASAGG